jgi:hypothetical protein
MPTKARGSAMDDGNGMVTLMYRLDTVRHKITIRNHLTTDCNCLCLRSMRIRPKSIQGCPKRALADPHGPRMPRAGCPGRRVPGALDAAGQVPWTPRARCLRRRAKCHGRRVPRTPHMPRSRRARPHDPEIMRAGTVSAFPVSERGQPHSPGRLSASGRASGRDHPGRLAPPLAGPPRALRSSAACPRWTRRCAPRSASP